MSRSFNSETQCAAISAPEQNVFSNRLNHWKLMSACRSSARRLFHSFGHAAAKHLSPLSHNTRPWCGRTQLWQPNTCCRRRHVFLHRLMKGARHACCCARVHANFVCFPSSTLETPPCVHHSMTTANYDQICTRPRVVRETDELTLRGRQIIIRQQQKETEYW